MMQDKYELRITLTNSTAINILKNLDNYGLRRKIIECAIIKFAKSNGKLQVDLFEKSCGKVSKNVKNASESGIQDFPLQKREKGRTNPKKKDGFKIQYIEDSIEKDNKGCFMFDFGDN